MVSSDDVEQALVDGSVDAWRAVDVDRLARLLKRATLS
jgi:hypothetical protein